MGKQKIAKTILSNGVRILTASMPFVRSVSMGVWVDVGARDEGLQENGLCHLIEHMIFKGTQQRSAFQIAKEFDAIGGQTNAFTSMENTCYHAKVMDTHLATMVDILSDIFLNSRFDEEEVAKERPVILQEIGMVEDNPEEFVHILTSQGFWQNHALGRSVLGTRENVSRFSASTIKAFFKRFYHPQKIVIAAAGNLTHEALVDMVAPRFESIHAGQPIPERMAPQTFKGLKVQHRHLEQVHLCLGTSGLATTDPRRYANSLMNTILGGNMSSRLFQEIRESRGLAYAVYSYITSHQDAGMFGAYAGVDPAHVSVTTQLILEAMDGLKSQKVSAGELQAAKEFIKGNLLLAAESNDNQMVRLAQNEIYYKDYLPLKAVVERIDAVTPDDIIELANELFHSEKLYLTALGPLDDQSAFTPEVMKMVA